MKTCSRCHHEKPQDQFSHNRGQCKSCRAELMRKESRRGSAPTIRIAPGPFNNLISWPARAA